MEQGHQLMLWGAAICAVVGINLLHKKDPDALGLSLVILMIWCASRVLSVAFEPPQHLQFAAVMDLMAAGTAIWAWSTRRAFWKLALACTYGFQIAASVVYWTTPSSGANYVWYATVLNSTLVLQLVLVGGAGALHGLAGVLSYLLPSAVRRAHISRH